MSAMRWNVLIRQLGRAAEVTSPVGVLLQVEADSPQKAADLADAWVQEHKEDSFELAALIPRGVNLGMELHDPAERGEPGGMTGGGESP